MSSFLILALIPAAAAQPDLTPLLRCDGGVCVFVRADDYGTCAGAGIGLQGAVACQRPDGCVAARFGFNDDLNSCGIIVLS